MNSSSSIEKCWFEQPHVGTALGVEEGLLQCPPRVEVVEEFIRCALRSINGLVSFKESFDVLCGFLRVFRKRMLRLLRHVEFERFEEVVEEDVAAFVVEVDDVCDWCDVEDVLLGMFGEAHEVLHEVLLVGDLLVELEVIHSLFVTTVLCESLELHRTTPHMPLEVHKHRTAVTALHPLPLQQQLPDTLTVVAFSHEELCAHKLLIAFVSFLPFTLTL